MNRQIAKVVRGNHVKVRISITTVSRLSQQAHFRYVEVRPTIIQRKNSLFLQIYGLSILLETLCTHLSGREDMEGDAAQKLCEWMTNELSEIHWLDAPEWSSSLSFPSDKHLPMRKEGPTRSFNLAARLYGLSLDKVAEGINGSSNFYGSSDFSKSSHEFEDFSRLFVGNLFRHRRRRRRPR